MGTPKNKNKFRSFKQNFTFFYSFFIKLLFDSIKNSDSKKDIKRRKSTQNADCIDSSQKFILYNQTIIPETEKEVEFTKENNYIKMNII
jgi:hypothetical protein